MSDTTPAGKGSVRRLAPEDLARFRAHLLRLDAESRYDRFAMAVSDTFLEDYAARCFGIDDVIFGFVVGDDLRGAGELRGIVPGGDLPGMAEAAFSVEKGWRRAGIGSALFGEIVRAAKDREVATLFMSCLARNRAMQAMARRFAAELSFEVDHVTGRLVAHAAPANGSAASGFATAVLDLPRTRSDTVRAQPRW